MEKFIIIEKKIRHLFKNISAVHKKNQIKQIQQNLLDYFCFE